MTQAVLALADGTVFYGRALGARGTTVGEVVFNTAMSGYQEILSDPSYAGQIVTLTASHVGNVGCNPADMESSRCHTAGLVIRDYPRRHSNWRTTLSLDDFLREQNIVGISGLDTRRLTRHLRENGAMPGCIMTAAADSDELLDSDAQDPSALARQAVARAQACPPMQGRDLASVVSATQSFTWEQSVCDLDGAGNAAAAGKSPVEIAASWLAVPDTEFHVVAYDFGVKHNILRLLTQRGCRLTVVPARTPAAEVLALNPDGVFLSNGPGDPEPCDYAITAIRELLQRRIPLFGICLGHQLLALAAGAATVKMKFGHHGANHPVLDETSGRVLITSQNHGFAVDEDSLPDNVRITHRSLFDNSVQGIALADRPAFGFQGHPEASPGPHDAAPLFDRFIDQLRTQRGQATAVGHGG